jgi:hypothetical protein
MYINIYDTYEPYQFILKEIGPFLKRLTITLYVN